LLLQKTVGILFLVLLLLDPALTLAASDVDTRREDQLLKTALGYIEMNRKGRAQIQFVDGITGKPVSGTEVQYQQTTHDFMFGTFLVSDPEKAHELGLEWSGTLELSWAEMEPEKGVYDFSQRDDTVRWLRKDGQVRLFARFTGLLLDWNYLESQRPPSYADFDHISDPVVFARYKDQVYEFAFNVATHYKGTISAYMTQWEINLPSFAVTSGLAKRPAWTVQQAVELDAVVTRAVRNADPSAVIMLASSGAWKTDSMYDVDSVGFTKLCIAQGADFDVVAYEFYPPEGGPAVFYDRVKEIGSLGKAIFTEETAYPSEVPAKYREKYYSWYSTWKWNVFNEHVQAMWYRYMFTLAFGMKESAGVGILSVRDNYTVAPYFHTYASAGLYTAEWQPKESAALLRELIANFTTSGRTPTDGSGVLVLRGFAGNYTVNVEGYEPFIVHVPEAVTINSTITLIPKKPQFSTTTTTSTSLSTTAISQQTVPFEGPPGVYLIPLAVTFMALVVATVLWSRRKKRTSKK
jgi:hypothetical protein